MDPRDLLRPPADGASCTACGATVPAGRIRILARREDVAFVELTCRTCGSEALALLIAPTEPDGPPSLDVDADRPEGSRPAAARSLAEPISAADVATIRDALAAWRGDLVGWLASLDDPRRGADPDR